MIRPAAGGAAQAPEALSVVGRRMRKVDGLAKATGRARYTDDIALPGMLHGKILRSPHPHARILAIDTSRAAALEGVHAVVTGRDMPTTYGIIPWTPDEHPLCVDRVRYVGDGVAAVAAVDEDTANAALELIKVAYEELPAYLDPHDAIAATDGPFIHEPRKPGRNGNVTKVVKLAFGDVEAGIAAAREEGGVVVEGDYFFEGTTHTPIEPHCAIGLADASGKLTVWSATQVPHYLHRELARVLELDPAMVRVVQPPVGGAFGGKSEPFDLEFCVAKLSMITGRPVKILYTREEVFYSHRGRHPFHMRYRTGARADGVLAAVDAEIVMDGGAYASFGLVTTYYSGQLLTAPYQMPAYRFHSTRAYTNKPACGPKRGHGSVQPRFAFEVQLDRIAEALEIDPIELRRRNALGEGTRTVNDLRVTSNGFLECLAMVEDASAWRRKFRRLPYGRGVGVAGSTYISGTNYPVYPNGHAPVRRAAPGGPVGAGGRVLGGVGDRPGRRFDGGLCGGRGAGCAAGPRAGVRGRHRLHAGGPGRLLLSGHVHAGERLHRRRAPGEAAGAESGRRGVGREAAGSPARRRVGGTRRRHGDPDADPRGLQLGRGGVRRPGGHRVLRHAQGRPRELPGRHNRRVARLLLHGPCGRGGS